MAKDNLRLISARIDEDSYEKIKEITNKHTYWTKNYIIRRILFAVLSDFDDDDIYDMLRRPNRPIYPPKCEYRFPYTGDDSKQ